LIGVEDDRPGAPNVAVIAYALWQRAFAGRQDVVGSRLTIGTLAFTVIGVAPRGFVGLSSAEIIDPDFGAPEVFLPLAAAPLVRAAPGGSDAPRVDDGWLRLVGRLRPGVTLAQARGELEPLARALETKYPRERAGAFATLQTGGGGAPNPGEAVAGVAFVMLVPMLVLLVACANLANQLLVRGVERRREIAVRLSLGATRRRIVRLLLVETLLLSLAACALALLLARAILMVVGRWFLDLPFGIPLDFLVFGFTIGLALLSAVVFGLSPALRSTRGDLVSALKAGAAAGLGTRGTRRLRGTLVVVQVAASLALITVSGTFIGIARRGDTPVPARLEDHLLLAAVNLDLLKLDSLAGWAYQARVRERLSALPGVTAVGMSPLGMFELPQGEWMAEVGANSVARPEWGKLIEVSGDWFAATATRPLRGRLFPVSEPAGAATVAVVDQEFARQWWRNVDPLGRRLRLGPDSAARVVTVIGVVPTRSEMAYRRPEGVVIVPAASYHARNFFFVGTGGQAQAMKRSVAATLRQVDSRVPVLWLRTMEEVAAQEAAPLRLIASGLGGLGTLALALAALGLFGVLAFVVAQRRQEIGIRVALGARRADVSWMVLRQALILAGIGIVTGGLLSAATVTLLRSIIFGLEPIRAGGVGLTAAIMIAVAITASLIPARRALRVDPAEVLSAGN
jgi:predicted permease